MSRLMTSIGRKADTAHGLKAREPTLASNEASVQSAARSTNYFFIVVVIRYGTTATARWTLMFINCAFINYTIAVAVWTRFSFHVRTMLVWKSRSLIEPVLLRC
jgi:hypothetical protein